MGLVTSLLGSIRVLAGDEWRDVDLAVGHHVQQAQVNLFVDGHRRPKAIGAHADTDHDDARE
jgi:hypothetical protein